MFVRDLRPGDTFNYNGGKGYVCESVRSGGGKTAVTYTLDGYRFEFVTASMATVEVVR